MFINLKPDYQKPEMKERVTFTVIKTNVPYETVQGLINFSTTVVNEDLIFLVLFVMNNIVIKVLIEHVI